MTGILRLDRSHNKEMLEILRRSPVEAGGLTLCFDRQPDMFAMAELAYAPAVWTGVFENGTLMGYGLVGYHDAYVNGAIQKVMHLTDCYFRPECRGRGYLSTALPRFFDHGGASLGYSVVMRGNRAPETILGKKYAAATSGLRSRFFGEITAKSLLLHSRRHSRPHLPVRRARMEDIDEIVDLLRAEHMPRLFGLATSADQFAARVKRPGLSITDYFVAERAGRLAGVCAAWDTCAFKQDRVLRYGFWLKLLRPLSHVPEWLGRSPALPAPGEPFREVFLTDWAVRDRSAEVMHALIRQIECEYRPNYHALVFGSCSHDPILEAARGYPVSGLAFQVALLDLGGGWLNDGAVDTRLPFVDLALL